MEIDFENIYKIPLKALRVSRSHPEVPRDTKWILQFLVMHGIFTFKYCIVCRSIVFAVEDGDYTAACRHGIVSVIFWVISFQYFILVVKQDTIMNIMNMMKNDFKKYMPDDEKILVKEYANKGSNVCHKWFMAIFITVAMFPIKLLTKELYLYMKGEFELQFIYPMTYPAFIEEHKMQPFIYTLLNILFSYFELYGACMYIAFVPLGPSFMLHACGQLEIIKKRATELFVNPSREEIKIKLIEMIKHLQYIYKFVDNITDIFMIMYELAMKASTIILPITLYQVIETFRHGEISFEFTTFLYSGTLFVSLPCFYSDMLMEKSEEVREAIYCCGWESVYDRDSRSTMKLILLRALRPCSIRTVFRTMCLDALTDVFQQAYALLNLMNAAWG